MASRNNELQYILIDDFSPGIYDDSYNTNGARPAPKGAATLTNTYGCLADNTGGLVPAPISTNNLFADSSTFDGQPFDAAHYPDLQIRIIAAKVYGPVFLTTFATDDMLVLLHAYWYNSTGVGGFAASRYKVAPQIWSTAGGLTYSPTALASTGNSRASAAYGPGTIDFSRANTTTPSQVGHPIVAMLAPDISATLHTVNGLFEIYPANATPTVHSIDSRNGNLPGDFLFAHQDRLVFISGQNNTTAFGGFATSGEAIIFTNVNDYTNISTIATFVSENATGAGSWFTQNASQAVVIKRNYGGYIISGPMEQPTITRMPGIPGADPPNLPARLNDGTIMYGNRRGVWLWSGGDTAQLASSQLNPGFWIPSNYDAKNLNIEPGVAGQFAYCYPHVWCPNNFLYDTRYGSWWKLNNSATNYVYWDVSSSGNVIGVVNTWGSTTTLADVFDYTTEATSYSWQSQPLQETLNRNLTFRELNITTQALASGSTLTITFVDKSGNTISTTPVQTLTNTAYPITLSIPIDVEANDVQLRVVSSGSGGSGAPRIYRIAIGYKEAQTAR